MSTRGGAVRVKALEAALVRGLAASTCSLRSDRALPASRIGSTRASPRPCAPSLGTHRQGAATLRRRTDPARPSAGPRRSRRHWLHGPRRLGSLASLAPRFSRGPEALRQERRQLPTWPERRWAREASPRRPSLA